MTAPRSGLCYEFVCVGLSVTMSAGYGVVQAQVACPVYQVTRTVDVGLGFENNDPSINAAGTRIAFVSAANYSGQNPGPSPRYSCMTRARARLLRSHTSTPATIAPVARHPPTSTIRRFDAPSGSFVQVSKGTNGGYWAAERPSISAAGNRIAFSDIRNPTGQSADGNRELFLTACVTPPKCDGQIPAIVGTPFNDVLSGTAGADVIVGLGGVDTLSGLGGTDRVCGGDGTTR
jgi:Ca2+-binding RTX toxin-like protein